jgi:hypothetical protein
MGVFVGVAAQLLENSGPLGILEIVPKRVIFALYDTFSGTEARPRGSPSHREKVDKHAL